MRLCKYANDSWPLLKTTNTCQTQTIKSFEQYTELLSLGAKTSRMIQDLLEFTRQESITSNWRLHDVDEMFYRMCRHNHVYPKETSVGMKSMYINPGHVVTHGLPYWDMYLSDFTMVGLDACTFQKGALIEIATSFENKNNISHLIRITKEACIHAGRNNDASIDLIQKYADENGYYNCQLRQLDSKSSGNIYTIEALFINGSNPSIVKMADESYVSFEHDSAHFKHTILMENVNTPRILTI